LDKNSLANLIIKLFKKNYPHAMTSLKFGNEYQFLVMVVLSARSTDEQVNRVSGSFFNKFPDIFSLAEASSDEVSEYIKGCGLYRNKSRNLVKMAQALTLEHGGKVPFEWNKLLSLPGVGRKTANLVQATLFNYPAFPVDTHVYRVAKRLELAKGDKVEEVEEELKIIFPEEEWIPLHHRFINHGRKLCLSRKPRCIDCFINSWCASSLIAH